MREPALVWAKATAYQDCSRAPFKLMMPFYSCASIDHKRLDFSVLTSGSVHSCRMAPGSPGSTQYKAKGWPLPIEWRRTLGVKSEPKQKPTGRKPAAANPTRQQQLAKLLERKSGATIAQLQKAFDWQPHTARAAISTLRKTGLVVERSDADKGAVYRIVRKG